MKTRLVVTPDGQQLVVPQGIQRIDSQSTHGWQVRYQGTRYFGDGGVQGRGPAKSLALAVAELVQRMKTLPPPLKLRRAPSPRKTSTLPVGISGPKLAHSGDGTPSAVLQVILPRYGATPQVRSVHIGTPSTYTQRRYKLALARAVALRAEAEARYAEDAVRAQRKAATAIRSAMKSEALGLVKGARKRA